MPCSRGAASKPRSPSSRDLGYSKVKPVLHDVSSSSAGQASEIGRSHGVGKSTVREPSAALLLSVVLTGADRRIESPTQLAGCGRKSASCCQYTILFAGTIRDNIAYVGPEADRRRRSSSRRSRQLAR